LYWEQLHQNSSCKNLSFFKLQKTVPEMEFKEFEPRFKSAKNPPKPGLNLAPWLDLSRFEILT